MNVIDDLNSIAQSAQASQALLGTVTAIDSVNASLTVQTAAPDPITGIRWLAHYTPAVNDFVVLMQAGNGWWVVGKNSKDLRASTRAYGSADYRPTATFEGQEFRADGIGSWAAKIPPFVGLWSEEPGMPSADEAYSGLWRLSGEMPAGATIISAKLVAQMSLGWDYGNRLSLIVSTHSYSGTPPFPPTVSNSLVLEPTKFEARPREYSFDLSSGIAAALAAGTARGIHVEAPNNYGYVVMENVRVVIEYFTGA